jgi:hypothetical protein
VDAKVMKAAMTKVGLGGLRTDEVSHAIIGGETMVRKNLET